MTTLAALLQRSEYGSDGRTTVPASEDDLRRIDEALAVSRVRVAVRIGAGA